MDGLSWLEYSLQQSLRQAFEVLERSSRRVNWSDRPRKFAPLPSNGPKATAALEEAFSSIRDFMNYYDSEGCTDGTVIEQRHGERYHKKIHPTSKSTSRQHQGQPSNNVPSDNVPPDDFYVVLAPGSYTITASQLGLEQQTKMINLEPGDTVNITFNFKM
ncbi:A-kinase-interacting protein 1 isoform X2 [Stigmatopora nigra]